MPSRGQSRDKEVEKSLRLELKAFQEGYVKLRVDDGRGEVVKYISFDSCIEEVEKQIRKAIKRFRV